MPQISTSFSLCHYFTLQSKVLASSSYTSFYELKKTLSENLSSGLHCAKRVHLGQCSAGLYIANQWCYAVQYTSILLLC